MIEASQRLWNGNLDALSAALAVPTEISSDQNSKLVARGM